MVAAGLTLLPPQIALHDLFYLLARHNLLVDGPAFASRFLSPDLETERLSVLIHSTEVDTALVAQEASGKGRGNPMGRFLYVARKGARFDGHLLAEKVLSAGSFCLGSAANLSVFPRYLRVTDTEKALQEIFLAAYDLSPAQFASVGITGTNGKTSVTHICAELLATLKPKTDVLKIGTLGVRLGTISLPVSHVTTPDFPSFLGFLDLARRQGASDVVMEVTSHGLQEKRLGNWKFDVAVFTNLTQDHLDYHGSFSQYRMAKQKLFLWHVKKTGTAVFCVRGDEWPSFVAAAGEGGVRRFFGVGDQSEKEAFFKLCLSFGGNVSYLALGCKKLSLSGLSGVLSLWTPDCRAPVAEHDFFCPLLGDFQFDNVLCSVAAVLSQGFCLAEVVRLLSRIKGIPGRLEKIGGEKGPTVLVDYAHSPDALERALLTCRLLLPAQGQLVTVFGCGGDRDKTKRSVMGKIAGRLSDFVVVTSDNPRTEDPEKIALEIVSGMDHGQNLCVELDRKKAVALAILKAKEFDIVLVAGKGHENYQLIGSERYPFSDAAVAEQILKGKS